MAFVWCEQFGGDPEEFPFKTLEELVYASFEKEK